MPICFSQNTWRMLLLIPSGRMLTEAVKTIDEIYKELEKENRFIDAQGDFYEYLLDSLRSSGKNGQFRTPTHIIELITELVEPKLGSLKLPTSKWNGRFLLLAAYKYIITEFTSDDYKQKDDNRC